MLELVPAQVAVLAQAQGREPVWALVLVSAPVWALVALLVEVSVQVSVQGEVVLAQE